jgi:hypothetical protein
MTANAVADISTGLKRFLLIVFLVVPTVNFGVFLLPVGDQQISDMPQTRVDAAGYAFSIWGIIFAAMIAFSVVIQRDGNGNRLLGAGLDHRDCIANDPFTGPGVRRHDRLGIDRDRSTRPATQFQTDIGTLFAALSYRFSTEVFSDS